jgi:hypothetical protein
VQKFLLETLESNPDLYLDKMAEVIANGFGVLLPITTIWNILKCLGITRKKVCYTYGLHDTITYSGVAFEDSC